jgi:hypothetical protein
MKRALVALLAVALVWVAPAVAEEAVAQDQEPGVEAIYAYSGRYTFRIDARNRHFRSINRGTAYASVSGNRATIRVRSDGYRDANAYVYLRDGQTSYTVRVTMDDPQVWFDLKDENYQNVYANSREDNFGVWADEYKIVSRVLADGFTKFERFDVDVRVNGMMPFGEQVRVRRYGNQAEIEITLKRRDLRSFSNRVEVRIPSDAALGETGSERRKAFLTLYPEAAAE